MEYIFHLQKDKKLGTIVTEPFSLLKRSNVPYLLMCSIMGQQLSTKVAAVIKGRFLALYKGKEPTPKQVLNTPMEKLRAIGLSNAKVSYVQNVARFCIAHKISDKKLECMSNEEIIELLTQIKGVGRWTVEMLLMFTLAREDVFAADDLGLQQAMIKLYRIKSTEKKELRKRMLKISEKWSPYRTYASMHLWQWKDKKPL